VPRHLTVMGLALLATWLGPQAWAAQVFVQAEDFECEGEGWSVQDQASRYAPDSGLKHLWGAQGGEGFASKEVQIPEAGRYVIWVRHTVMRGDEAGYNRGAFLVSIREADRALAQASFDEQPPEEAPRYVHRYDWSRFEADLPAGAVRIEVSKLPPVTCSGWTRYVDCLVLTTDAEYVPKVSDFQPKMWLRVTLGPTQATPIYIHCFCDHFRAPWYKHFSLSKDGYEERVRPTRGEAAYLSAGEATPWCDITPAIHEDRGARLELRGAEKYSYTEWLPSLEATFEFATAPDAAAVVKRFERKGPGAGLVIVTPGVLNGDTADKLKADVEFCEEAAAFAESLPRVRFGKRPERFPLFLSMRLRAGLFAPEIRQAEYGIAAQMGFNGTYDGLDPMLRSLGFSHTRTGTTSWYMDNDCYLQPQTEKIRERIALAAEEWRDEPPTLVMFMDEPGAKPLSHAASCERCAEAFIAWLRDELDVPLADLGKETWAEVRPVAEQEKATLPALYYYSQRFRAKALGDFLRLQTGEITEAFGGSPPATVNFSDGAVYQANMYLQGADYFHLFRSNALTMAWSEDWSNIASTYQCCGYNVDLLRAASKYHGQPIGMYVITSYGRTPLDVKLKAYSSLGRGARMLQSFAYGPTYATHEPNWYLRKDMYHPMTELCHEIGGAEDLLLQAKRIPSQVAFLYSTTSDIWTVGESDLYGHDRMHSYLALIHAQVPVDFLSEEDVVEGRLGPYKVLYLFGPNLLRSAAGPIAEWATAGGALYLAAGAAVADEYNRPARPLDEALGLARGEVETLEQFTGPGRYLQNLVPHGQVTFAGAELDILGLRQAVAVEPSARVSLLARSDDLAPMAARVDCGEGTVYAVGFMPGLSYIRKALLKRDAHGTPAPRPDDEMDLVLRGSFSNLAPHELSYNPWEYPEAEREFLLEPVRHAQVEKPVTLSERLVESFYLEGPGGAVVTLANYRLQPVERLKVAIRAPRRPTRLVSVREGALDFEVQGDAIALELALLDTDMLKLYW
jgi:hypothetical protein